MKTRKIQIAIIALLFVGALSNEMYAQKGKTSWGAAASLIVPTGDFSSRTENIASTGFNRYLETTHGTGWGISAIGKYGLNDFLTVVGTVGYNSVSEEITEFETTAPDEYEKAIAKSSDHKVFSESGTYTFMDFTAGLRANVSFLYVEARAGYYSGDQGGFAFVPAVGAEYKNFDIQASYALVGDASHVGIRLGYYFL